jgi:hypothetical protein
LSISTGSAHIAALSTQISKLLSPSDGKGSTQRRLCCWIISKYSCDWSILGAAATKTAKGTTWRSSPSQEIPTSSIAIVVTFVVHEIPIIVNLVVIPRVVPIRWSDIQKAIGSTPQGMNHAARNSSSILDRVKDAGNKCQKKHGRGTKGATFGLFHPDIHAIDKVVNSSYEKRLFDQHDAHERLEYPTTKERNKTRKRTKRRIMSALKGTFKAIVHGLQQRAL